MKRKNKTGSVYKLSGKRRNPYAARITTGWTINEETQKSYPIYKFIGYYPTHDEALAALLEYNKNPYEICDKTFAELFEAWMKTKKDLKRSSINRYNLSFKYLEPLHDVKIKDINMVLLQGYFDELVATKDVISSIFIVLNQSFEYAAKRGMASITLPQILNLIEATPRKESRKLARVPFSKEERKILWEHKNDKFVRMILVYIYTGLRYEELYNLTEDCCHDDYIEIKEAKTAAGVRDVPLCDCVKDLLPIEPIPKYDLFRYHFTETMNQLNLYKHTIHDTRHTFITMMTEVETDARILKKIVGHSDKTVTENVYTHISIEKKIEAVNRINCY